MDLKAIFFKIKRYILQKFYLYSNKKCIAQNSFSNILYLGKVLIIQIWWV